MPAELSLMVENDTHRAWRLLLCVDMKTLSPLHLWQSIYTCNKSLTHQTHLNNQLQTGIRPYAWTECFRCWKGSENPHDIVYHTSLFLHPRSSEKNQSKQSSSFKSVFSKVLMKHHLVRSLRSSNQRLLVVPKLWNSLHAFTLRLKNKSLLLSL